MSPLREVHGCCRTWGSLCPTSGGSGGRWGVAAPEHPTSSEGQLRALPSHLGKVWGSPGVPVIRSWGLPGHGSPGRGGGSLGRRVSNPPGVWGGRWQRSPPGKVGARLGRDWGGLGALPAPPALPNPQPSPQTLPGREPQHQPVPLHRDQLEATRSFNAGRRDGDTPGWGNDN